ncbi:MAG: zinc-binding dehydrogenase [Brumimicrobium sp.]|nr:zinc-binding dehydrogenase [Brumimicrobium sp.]
MKAVRFVGKNQPLENHEIPIPEIGANDVLIQIKAAGICHSDVNYKAGILPTAFTPITLGHEISGIIEKVGSQVTNVKIGDRVCVHYVVTCGNCVYCTSGQEQFCPSGQMIGCKRDGGFAEYIAVPARNAVPLPAEISFEEGAIMMCSSATSFHALIKGRIQVGDNVAVFGVGGLGQSAVQLAKIFGANQVFAVDINPAKLDFAQKYGAIPVNAAELDVVTELKRLTNGKGVDVALELAGLPLTQKQAIKSVGVMGRVVFVGLTTQNIEVNTYKEILGNEVELIGANDHHLKEIYTLLEYSRNGRFDTSKLVSNRIPLEAALINEAIDKLKEARGSEVRTVIVN